MKNRLLTILTNILLVLAVILLLSLDKKVIGIIPLLIAILLFSFQFLLTIKNKMIRIAFISFQSILLVILIYFVFKQML